MVGDTATNGTTAACARNAAPASDRARNKLERTRVVMWKPSSVGMYSRRRGERERDRVHAVTQPGRLRAIVEHMAQVRIATRARHLGADHAQHAVFVFDHVLRRNRLPETRPAGAGFE